MELHFTPARKQSGGVPPSPFFLFSCQNYLGKRMLRMSHTSLSLNQKRLKGDSILKTIVGAAAVAVIVLLLGLAYELYSGSRLSISKFGLTFLGTSTWDPVHSIFGALPFIYGTAVTSALTLLFGLPISLGTAIFLVEKIKTKRTLKYLLGTLIELLAAVPSVIYGLWGLFFLSPLLRDYIEKPLHVHLGFVPLFSSPPYGLDFFTAGIILAIMVIPTITAVSRDVLNAVPNSQREAMYSIGRDGLGSDSKECSAVREVGPLWCDDSRTREGSWRNYGCNHGYRKRAQDHCVFVFSRIHFACGDELMNSQKRLPLFTFRPSLNWD